MFVAEIETTGTQQLQPVLRARTLGRLFHKCQRFYGICIGRLVDYDIPNPVWRFARCSGKFSSCQTVITDVTVYWEGK